MSFLDECFQDDPQDAAQFGLLMLMTGISESAWCASWMSGLEIDLWKIAHGEKQPDYGQEVITERQRTLLLLLSEEADGWWVYDDNGPKFIRGWKP